MERLRKWRTENKEHYRQYSENRRRSMGQKPKTKLPKEEADRRRKEASRAFYLRNRDRILEQVKNYPVSDSSKKKASERQKKWRKENPEKAKLKGDMSYAKQKLKPGYAEHAALRTKEWTKNNPQRAKDAKRKRYQEIKHVISQEGKQYRRDNLQEVRRIEKVRRDKNVEKVRESSRRTYRKYSEKRKEYVAKWQKLNPDKTRVHRAKRKAIVRDSRAESSTAKPKIIKAFYDQATRLQKCLGIPFYVDHIKPIAEGGAHHHANLRSLPAILNHRKSKSIVDPYPHW